MPAYLTKEDIDVLATVGQCNEAEIAAIEAKLTSEEIRILRRIVVQLKKGNGWKN